MLSFHRLASSSPSYSSSMAYLEIILGGMYAGKTSRLIELYKQFTFCGMSVVVINHVIDTRYGDVMMTAHDSTQVPCLRTDQLATVAQHPDVIGAHVMLINEGQFFPDLKRVVTQWLQDKKTVYVCGLDGDFQRNKFGEILDLIPLCDRVHKLTSFCAVCKNGTPGIFSKRLSYETTQTVVGSVNYLPVCRQCYEKEETKEQEETKEKEKEKEENNK